ncbi:MAG: aminoacyl-tRNA hydrolase [Ignavibacteriaceae bacterium]
MRVILGIGNPGNRYKNNRHNIGFMFLDFFADSYSLKFTPSKKDYYFATGRLDEYDFSIIKPSTFVNNSGTAALNSSLNFDTRIEDILVGADDINLDPGVLKIKSHGGDGGHNGIASIIYHLNSNKFPRLRIGVGNNFESGSMAEYVLSDFNSEELMLLEKSFEKGKILVDNFIKGGLKQMLDYHSIIFNHTKLPGNNNLSIS